MVYLGIFITTELESSDETQALKLSVSQNRIELLLLSVVSKIYH